MNGSYGEYTYRDEYGYNYREEGCFYNGQLHGIGIREKFNGDFTDVSTWLGFKEINNDGTVKRATESLGVTYGIWKEGLFSKPCSSEDRIENCP
jgi:hypothetical protein